MTLVRSYNTYNNKKIENVTYHHFHYLLELDLKVPLICAKLILECLKSFFEFFLL